MAKEKILIVDDEIDVLDLCKRILESQGYEADTAHNGYEAVELARSEEFDLLLTDIKMPGMNGLEIAQALKESDPGVICVTMTGYSTMDMAINALKLGIDEFILKPFTPKELTAAIAKALEKERLRKENFRLNSLIPLFEWNKTLMGTVEIENVLDRLLTIAQQETNAYLADLYLYDKSNKNNDKDNKQPSHHLFQSKQRNNGQLFAEYQTANERLAKLTLHRGEQLALSLLELPEQEEWSEILEEMAMSHIIATPLKSKNRKLGVLILAQKETTFAPGDVEFLSVLCGQASIALENARLFTEIQEAYRQLQMLDHMKSEFINIAAHELRTPLAILLGYASVLEEEAGAELQEFISNINRNAMRLRSLIDDMLNLQYLESGVASLMQDHLDLKAVIEQITQDISVLAEEKQLHINIDFPPHFPKMVIDRQKLDLILVNLIDNAIKFTPPGGEVNIEARALDNYARLVINNTGTTIPQENLERIFDRFYQVEDTLTRSHGGAGLGLAIVRGMVEVCGGDIAVESSEETGTTFTFTLPLDNSHLKPRKLKV